MYETLKFPTASERDEEFHRRKERGQRNLVRYSEAGFFSFDSTGLDTRVCQAYFVAWPNH